MSEEDTRKSAFEGKTFFKCAGLSIGYDSAYPSPLSAPPFKKNLAPCRDNELRERHQLFQMRKQMSERTEKRRKERERIAEKEMEGLDKEGEKEFKEKAASTDEQARKNAEAKSRIDIFENAFRKIKEATGVSDVNEVIQKIISQEGTTEVSVSVI